MSRIKEAGSFGKYFHIMLNMEDDELDPYQYRLLGHYRRICGIDGHRTCTEGIETTAKICKMSLAKARETRNSLRKLGYLDFNDDTKGRTIEVTIRDRMDDNIKHCTTPTKSDRGIKNITPIENDRPTPIENDRGTAVEPLSNPIPNKEHNTNNIQEPSVPNGTAANAAPPASPPTSYDLKEVEPSLPVGQHEPEPQSEELKSPPPKIAQKGSQTGEDTPPRAVQPAALEGLQTIPPQLLTAPPGFDIAYGADGKAHLFKSDVKQPAKCRKCHADLGTWSQSPGERSYAPCCDWFIVDPTWTQETKDELARICKCSWAIKSNERGMKAALGTISKLEPVTIEKLKRFERNWYRCDYRGKRGEHPQPYVISQMWVAYTESDDCKESANERDDLYPGGNGRITPKTGTGTPSQTTPKSRPILAGGLRNVPR